MLENVCISRNMLQIEHWYGSRAVGIFWRTAKWVRVVGCTSPGGNRVGTKLVDILQCDANFSACTHVNCTCKMPALSLKIGSGSNHLVGNCRKALKCPITRDTDAAIDEIFVQPLCPAI